MAISRDSLPDHVRREVNLQIADQDRKAAPYAEKGRRPTRKEGYGAIKTYSELIGRTFMSKVECEFAEKLWLLQKAGAIKDLAFQKSVTLLGTIRMRPDFRYIDLADGHQLVHHEFKGYGDDRWKQQRKLWSQFGPSEYRITYASGKSEVIYPRPNRDTVLFVIQNADKDDLKEALAIKEQCDESD